MGTDLPVNEGTLGVHEVELVIESSKGFGDSGRVVQHANGALDLGQVTARHHRRRLVVDADLEMREGEVKVGNGWEGG